MGVRGPKKHFKRIQAPTSWLLSKLGGTWAPRPSPGPHKLRECLPLSIAIRNRLKYALTRREVLIIVNKRAVQVDGKVRTDVNYPAGLMDVIRITKTDEQYRILYDVKGRFVMHRIPAEEGTYKLCRVIRVSKANKGTIGKNPFLNGQAATIPYIVTHDGRTIRYPDPAISTSDTVRVDIASGKVTGFLKFDTGAVAMITRGANIGRVGVIVSREKHPGSFDIVHLRDKAGSEFATRIGNVFIVGKDDKVWISLPRNRGVRMGILEEKAARIKAVKDKETKDKKRESKKEKK
jgi:small subunit ribosomal protein S4e